MSGGQNEGLETFNLPVTTQTESIADVVISDTLTREQFSQLQELLSRHAGILTDVPGRAIGYEHTIKLMTDEPVRTKNYAMPQAIKAQLRQEVENMLQAGIIEHSNSAYSSPSVAVKKRDGSLRYCIDFRKVNNISVFDSEPMPSLDELFQDIGESSVVLTKIDLSKGYWQIPLAEQSKHITAFATELGLFHFLCLPFGLASAGASFSRLMRRVLSGLPNVVNYLDDILVYSPNFSQHLITLSSVFERLHNAGLTVRPSKCMLAFPRLEFLGHMIGGGELSPVIDKVSAIRDAACPRTKKQMQSFLGLANFYRRYVPSFSTIVAPLTDTLKKGTPNHILWNETMENAFDEIKCALTSAPILKLPDFNRPFQVAVDASDTGLGAVLTQMYGDEKFPVIYLSRKLLPREARYSVVERECLALVWAVKKLHTYLYGREFVIESDHAPLLHLNKAKSENGRLMRWALLLSQYRFRIISVRGSLNFGPDWLSRA